MSYYRRLCSPIPVSITIVSVAAPAAPYLPFLLIAAPYMLAVGITITALVVRNRRKTKNNEHQLKINIKKNKELGPVAPNRK